MPTIFPLRHPTVKVSSLVSEPASEGTALYYLNYSSIGTGVALFFLVRSNFHSAVMVVHDNNKYLIRLRKDVSFLNKPIFKEKLESMPAGAVVLIDLTRADFIDKDVVDVINELMAHAHLKNIRVHLRKSLYKSAHREINEHTAATKASAA